jgi:hypothetical protein
MRRRGNLLASEIMGAATDLREALRPVVAFRGELEKCRTEHELQLAVLEANLPEDISKVLDLHHNLMVALAIGARVEAEKKGEISVERKVEQEIAREKTQPQVVQAPKASFLDD